MGAKRESVKIGFKKERPVLGLALSGGAVRGAAHIGVLEVLQEYAIEIDCIAGTSIGALIGALYAFGVPLDEIEAFARELDWFKISSFILPSTGLLSNDEMGRQIENLIGDVAIEDADIPLAIVATDIVTGERIVFRDGSVASAVMASSCLPGLYKPLEYRDRLLVDGLLVENVPVRATRELGAERVIAVNLGGNFTYPKPDGIIDVMMNSFEIAVDNNTKRILKAADVVISLDLTSYSRFDVDDVPALIDEGQNHTLARIEKIQHVARPCGRLHRWWRRLLSSSERLPADKVVPQCE
ncbi:MAG TPA: patatin [Bacteroidetes bacterium]|nr:patatin [Bacteroidota bacterium]